jgi:hypothetical protein
MCLNPARAVQVGSLVVEAFGRLVFRHGHVHTDLHAGNVLVETSSLGRPTVVLLDHGATVQLDDALRREYCLLWAHLPRRMPGLFSAGNVAAMRASCERLGGEAWCRFHPLLFQGDAAAQWCSLAAVPRQEREALEAEVRAMGAQAGGVPAEYLRFMRALPPEVRDCHRPRPFVSSGSLSNSLPSGPSNPWHLVCGLTPLDRLTPHVT